MENSAVKHDTIDLLRAEFIKDIYLLACNKREKYDIVDNASFGNEPLSANMISDVYDKYPLLYSMDEKYLKNGNYVIGFNVISRHRLLKNLGNYRGKGNAFEESLRFNSHTKNIEEVISTLSAIEMGDESVNISQGIQHNR